MYYYEVWVGSNKVHADEPLAYSSLSKLNIGELIQVPVRSRFAMGFVVRAAQPEQSIINKIKPIKEASGIVLPQQSIQLHNWIQSYYPSASGVIAGLFLPNNLPKYSPKKNSEVKTAKSTSLKPLTADQTQALKAIKRSSGTVLLHGDTGTGKTRVYLELAKQSMAANKSVVILTPEIGLTPQLVETFLNVFPGQVALLHSNLSPAKRRDTWYRIAAASQTLVIIGPRSALFAPLKTIGLVVVDEAHEPAYKQEQAPYYQASRVAAQLANLHKAKCIFGTATPSISDYQFLKQKRGTITRMTQLATGEVTPPKVSVVDLKNREELKSSSIISNTLIKAIEVSKNRGQQALLFLNRRGSARVILCQNCGWQATCPNCDIAMTYHGDQNLLRCHTCGKTQSILTSCPDCSSSEIIYHTPGTKSLEQEAIRLFPENTIKRFDSDNLADEKLEKHFKTLASGEVDIIIGTQLVTKGLDLPKLGVVGIINADTSLSFPDYTAEEKTFQQLAQVMGRVGRHDLPSEVVIQTYNPSSPMLKLVTAKDWQAFFDQQLVAREQFGFPPFSHLLQLRITRASRPSAQEASQKLVNEISSVKGIKIRGPSPRLHEKLGGKYHWQIIISSKQRQALLDIIKDLPSGWTYNIDPTNLM